MVVCYAATKTYFRSALTDSCSVLERSRSVWRLSM
jgi:hypothetical protein